MPRHSDNAAAGRTTCATDLRWLSCIILVAVLAQASCSQTLPSKPAFETQQTKLIGADEASYRILFVGNSHTEYHQLPQLVANLIQFHDSSKEVYAELVRVNFLEDVATNGAINERLQAYEWDAVVLQAQKISTSGKYVYSTSEGVAFAKHCKTDGRKVFFFAEWGLRGDDNNARQTAEIYRTMAEQSGATLIPVGQVWSSVLDRAPDSPLYSTDGNHQSRLGASLSSLVIASSLLGTSPMDFATFRDPCASPNQWELFCTLAAKALQEEVDHHVLLSPTH